MEASVKLQKATIRKSWVENIRPRPPWFREILRGVIYLIGHTISRIDIRGRRFIPSEGPLIIVGNHFSIWEPPMMIYSIPKPLNILAAGDLNWPISQRWALFLYGYIPTNRESFKPSTIREAKSLLESGKFVGIFPEAGMSPNYELREGKPGAVYLSALTNSQILPVGFYGYQDANAHWNKLSRPTFHIRIGKPFGPFHLSDKPDKKKDQMEKYGSEVMRQIAALLPPAHRGKYINDPGVKSLEIYNFNHTP